MPRRALLSLLPEDRLFLEEIVKRGENWRQRQRAKTLLLLDTGMSMNDVADHIEVNVRTIGSTRIQWLKDRRESLSDRQRSGAPKKMTAEQVEHVLALAKSQPLTAQELLAKHIEAGGPVIHRNTLTATLKAAGFVWKRTRHSLKKSEMKTVSDKRK
jgi:transposase